MPYKGKYKDLPEEIKKREREKALKYWNKKKQDPVFMEKIRAKRREYYSRPLIMEKRRILQNEYYKRKVKEPGWRKHKSELNSANRKRKIIEIPGYKERERSVNKAWENTINGRALHLLKHAKIRASKKGHTVEITKEWLVDKLTKGVCDVTGIQFKKENNARGPFTASLDRIDNNVGYTIKNTRVVIWAFNRAKGEWRDEIIHTWITEYMRLHNGC